MMRKTAEKPTPIHPESDQARPQDYDPQRFWKKLGGHARDAGRQVVDYALQLHYAAQRPETPAWARRTAYGALAYFILPIDAIPDFIAMAGYTDDLGALALAVSTLSAYIDDEVRIKARKRMESWFGSGEQAPSRHEVE